MGVRRTDIRQSTRMLVEAPYLLLYRTNPDTDEGPIDTVEIIRVIDGRRDPARHLLGARPVGQIISLYRKAISLMSSGRAENIIVPFFGIM
jgi:hypothetical protein